GGGISVTFPQVDTRQARLSIRTHLRNSDTRAHRFTIRQSLFDGPQVVSSTETTAQLRPNSARPWVQEVEAPNPRLWSPDHPNRYRMRTELFEGQQVLDSVTTQVGIR